MKHAKPAQLKTAPTKYGGKGSFYFSIHYNWTLQTGAVGNSAYRGTKANPPAPLSGGKARKLHLPDPINPR